MVRLRMMGGLMTWEVKSLVFIPASVFSYRTLSWAACWSMM